MSVDVGALVDLAAIVLGVIGLTVGVLQLVQLGPVLQLVAMTVAAIGGLLVAHLVRSWWLSIASWSSGSASWSLAIAGCNGGAGNRTLCKPAGTVSIFRRRNALDPILQAHPILARNVHLTLYPAKCPTARTKTPRVGRYPIRTPSEVWGA